MSKATKAMWIDRVKWSAISLVAVTVVAFASGTIVLGSTAADRVQMALVPHESPACLQAFLGTDGRTVDQVMAVKRAQNDVQAKELKDTYKVAGSIVVGRACGRLIDNIPEKDVADVIKAARAQQMIADASKK